MSKPERLSLIASLARIRKDTISRLSESSLSAAQTCRVLRKLRSHSH